MIQRVQQSPRLLRYRQHGCSAEHLIGCNVSADIASLDTIPTALWEFTTIRCGLVDIRFALFEILCILLDV